MRRTWQRQIRGKEPSQCLREVEKERIGEEKGQRCLCLKVTEREARLIATKLTHLSQICVARGFSDEKIYQVIGSVDLRGR